MFEHVARTRDDKNEGIFWRACRSNRQKWCNEEKWHEDEERRYSDALSGRVKVVYQGKMSWGYTGGQGGVPG
jgi:hypothetical protein